MAYAVIVAGGQGARMGADRPKQYLELAGKPVLEHTLRAFDRSGLFKHITLVLPKADLETWRIKTAGYALKSTLACVAGGARRQDSVQNALYAVKADISPNEIVCVHDAVRPLISPEQIDLCLKAAETHGAAVLGVPVNETLKCCDVKGQITATVPRENLWLAQTPQCFRFELLWRAYAHAAANNISATDDAALLEAAGIPVYMTRGARANIKITEPEDLILAEKLLS